MGKILKFIKKPTPEPVPEHPRLRGGMPPSIENISAKCLAAFRMLTHDFEAETRIPERMFLVYGSRWPKAKGRSPSSGDDRPDTLSWSYLALDMDPKEVVRVAKLTAKHLKAHPERQLDLPDPENGEGPDCA